MKKIYFVSLLLSFIIYKQAFAQKPVLLANGSFQVSGNIKKKNFDKAALETSQFNNRYHGLVQFEIIPTANDLKSFPGKGLWIGQYLNNNTYEAAIDVNFDFDHAATLGIISIDQLPASWKIDKQIFNQTAEGSKGTTVFALALFHASDKLYAKQKLRESGIGFPDPRYELPHIIVVQPDRKKLLQLASQPFISFIREVYIKDAPINYNDVATHSISALQNPFGRNLRGQGVVIGLGDNADINTHVDFSGKVITRLPWPSDSHGTHTGGTVAGGGFLNPRNQGMAPAAHLIDQWFSDVVVNAPVYLQDYNMPVTNNSYYSAAMGCDGNRVYNLLSIYADQQALDLNQSVLNVFAAGNDGGYSCSPYPASFGTMKTGWQVSKNVLTVGAIDQSSYLIASFSSRGPAADGRIKPEIVANGFATVSTYPNDSYATNYGTSMAAPVVTGVTALLQQSYRQLHGGAIAPSSLIKGILCNTAEDLGNMGPDYTYGFGMLNARKAVEALEAGHYFSGTSVVNGGTINHLISVPPGARRLKVMLVWADQPGAMNSGSQIVNDLDLTVTDPSLSINRPFVLDPFNVTANATTGVDRINNIEQVVMDFPAAGNYSLDVSAFALPTGSQPYYVVYQVDMNGVTVEYPSGGETLVPGETENIRWSAGGSETNNFTVSYSSDNGSNWTTIGTALFNARSLAWTIPNMPGKQYLIRVARNSSSYVDQSDNVFTVLGQPTLTTSVPCEGYAQLNWSAINSANDYDVFQLKGDSMALIGNTTNTSFLVSGLNTSDSAWFAVAARTSGTRGRRSLGVKVKPVSGTCSLGQFDNNLKAVAVEGPVSGRQFTSTALPASSSVKLRIRNLDNSSTSGSYSLSYRINGGTVVTENSSVIVASLGDVVYSFAATTAFASPGTYTITAWVKRSGDNQPENDTVSVTIRNLANPVLSLPFTDGFETATSATYTSTLGIEGDDKVDLSRSSSRGRARTFINSGLAYEGTKALTLDQYPYGPLNADSLTITFNLSNYNLSKQLRADFVYKNHGQPDAPGNRVWLRGVDNAVWTKAYDLNSNQANLGQWKKVSININEVMDTLTVGQTVSGSFQIRFGQEAYTSVNVVDPYVDQDDGYSFDNIKISEAINDVALLKIVSPSAQGCGLGSANIITLQIKNYSNTIRNNIALNYRVNGGAVVSQTLASLGAGVTTNFSFSSTVDMSAFQDYNIEAWITSPADNYASNDSILDFSIRNSPLITSYPYLEGFENNDGYWYTKGINSSWQWGHPNKSGLNRAANGQNAWMTSLEGNYNDNEKSYLYSPCFDLSSLAEPMLSFSFNNLIELDYDFAWVEYSTDGSNWQKLGSSGQGTNWYDNAGFSNWKASKPYWHVASIPLPTGATNFKIRFVLASDVGVNEEGIGIDDIHIFSRKQIYAGGNQSVSQPVNGSNWTDVLSSGKIIASINPGGQNLGTTDFSVYPYTGTVRFSNNEYYLNRNFVIRPSNSPSANVKVRLYFTDSEVESLRNASACGTCPVLNDAYLLGVTKYTGVVSDENGNLADDQGGLFQFIPGSAVEIIPYDAGYYAELTVNSFSEFWLSEASIQSSASNLCAGSDIQFQASQSGVTYQWQVNTGSGYQNITSGPQYSGYNTSTLQINNVPGSFTGYLYRCVVDGVNGSSITLRYRNVWTGAVSAAWANASNWSCGSVPDQYSDVYIPGNTTHQPILQQTTAVRTLIMYPTASLQTINNAVLTLLGTD